MENTLSPRDSHTPTSKPAFPFAPGTMLAPMEGVTHPIYRALLAEHGGIGVLCTEFVRIMGEPLPERALAKHVVKVPGVPLSVQLMGNTPEVMAGTAGMLERAGADVVDINLGCPTKRAARGNVGAAMLRDKVLLFDVLSAMRGEVKGLLSAKIRAGFDDADHVVEIAQTVQRAGADFIAVHPRRRADQYAGVADWRIIRTLKQALDIPVVGNGDVWYAADALRMRAETGCDAVMIGRPAMRNPWIFAQIAALTAGEEPTAVTGAMVVAFMRHVATTYGARFKGPHGGVGKFKELTRWIGRGIHDGRAFQKACLRAQTMPAMLEIAEAHLAGLGPDAIDLQADGPHRLERSGSAVLVET